MDKSRKSNWTKEEECSLINEIESAGEILRGSGNSADKNKRIKQIWKDIAAKLNSAHGNGRAVEDIRKKWTNLKLNAKSKVDASFREARKTGGGTNTAGHVDDEDMLIISADRNISDSADRVTEMFQNTPAFIEISGAVDLFQAPSVGSHEITSASTVLVAGPVEFEGTPVLESSEVEIQATSKTSKKSRKRRRTVDEQDDSVECLKAADLLPLQQEVLFQQMAVFSAQLQLIEEQRDYYWLKRQRLVEKSL